MLGSLQRARPRGCALGPDALAADAALVLADIARAAADYAAWALAPCPMTATRPAALLRVSPPPVYPPQQQPQQPQQPQQRAPVRASQSVPTSATATPDLSHRAPGPSPRLVPAAAQLVRRDSPAAPEPPAPSPSLTPGQQQQEKQQPHEEVDVGPPAEPPPPLPLPQAAGTALTVRPPPGTPSPACSPAGPRRGGGDGKERELRRTPRGSTITAPGAPAPEGAWLAALGIVDEVLQDSLVLQGRLYVRVVDRDSSAQSASSSAVSSSSSAASSSSSLSSSSIVTAAGFAAGSTSWNTPANLRRFTNARNQAVLEFYVPGGSSMGASSIGGSGVQEERLDGTIDLRTVQGVHYLRPRSVTALHPQQRARLTQFAVETPAKVYELEAASEAEAVYWVLGLKRIVLSPRDGVPAVRTPRAPQLAATAGAGTLAAADADVFASPAVQRVENSALMLQVTQGYLQQRMDEVSEELRLVEHTLRGVVAYAERIHQQYFALTRRKALLQHTRDELHSYSADIEARLASHRVPGSSTSTSSSSSTSLPWAIS